MTLVEFLHPINGGRQTDLVIAVLFHAKQFLHQNDMTATEIRNALIQAKVRNAKHLNVNSILNRCAPNVHAPSGRENGTLAFELTPTGDDYIRDLLNVPTIVPALQNEVNSLEAIASKISDPITLGFIEEAILCLSVNALRAAIVFTWSGAMHTLHDQAWQYAVKDINDAIFKHDPKAHVIKKIADFAYIKDNVFLNACFDLGIYDKSQKDTLIEALNLRNRCGHPVDYQPKVNKARSFIEDVVGILF